MSYTVKLSLHTTLGVKGFWSCWRAGCPEWDVGLLPGPRGGQIPEYLGSVEGTADACSRGERLSGHREVPWDAVGWVNRKGCMGRVGWRVAVAQ